MLGDYSSAAPLLSQYLTEEAGTLTQFVVLLLAFSFDPLRRLLEKKADRMLFGRRTGREHGRPGRRPLSPSPWRCF